MTTNLQNYFNQDQRQMMNHLQLSTDISEISQWQLENDGFLINNVNVPARTCKFNKQATHICSNPLCKSTQPFICRTNQFQCLQNHISCSLSSISFYYSLINPTQNQNPSSIIAQQFTKLIDSLIQEAKYVKDYMLVNIKQGKAIQSMKTLIDAENEEINFLTNRQTLSGSVMAKVIQLKKQSIVKKLTFNKIEHIKKQFNDLRLSKLLTFYHNLQRQTFWDNIQFRFDPQLQPQPQFQQRLMSLPQYHQSHSLNQQFYMQSKKQFSMYMISPGIKQLNRQFIKCRLKFEYGNDVLFGIGLKEKLKSKNFTISQQHIEKYGCFIRSYVNKIYVTGRQGQQRVIENGINLIQGDSLEMQLDLKKRMIYFYNMSTKMEYKIMLPFLPEINGDKFYFCVGTTSPDDRVYFI